MSCYFNQDFDLYGDNDRAIIEQFFGDSSLDEVAAAAVEIDRFLAMPIAGLSQRFLSETGLHNVSIGETDTQTREWLFMARRVLTEQPG